MGGVLGEDDGGGGVNRVLGLGGMLGGAGGCGCSGRETV
jgi:hypothetical protein